MNPKFLIIGHAGHGKDTVCELLQKHGNLQFCSSSLAAVDLGVFDVIIKEYLSDSNLPLSTLRSQLYSAKNNFRKEMFDAIQEYNRQDKTRLAANVLADSDIYCGMRSREEFQACKDKGLFNLVIWVDASLRKAAEPKTSNQLLKYDADIIISNDGTLKELEDKVIALCAILFR